MEIIDKSKHVFIIKFCKDRFSLFGESGKIETEDLLLEILTFFV